MTISKTLCLSSASALILAAHAAPSFAAIEYVYTQQGAGDGAASDAGDGGSLWNYICSLLW